MTIHTFEVQLNNAYPLYLGKNLLQQADYLRRHIAGHQVCIITNEQIAPLYLSPLKNLLNDFQCDSVVLPDGEQYKTWEQVSQILNHLIDHCHHRSTTLIALGGGVIGDITGFAASIYLRGVHLIQIPTSLLAQVDAAIGGKTAINHSAGKNLIGTFYQPQAVIIDTQILMSLPERHFRAGLSEVIKHALIADESFFIWLENNMASLLKRDQTSLLHAITRCCEIKAKIVMQDEREKNIRAYLNLGHTFAHAIEKLTQYTILHGESVAIGLVAMAKLSKNIMDFPDELVQRIISLLQQAELPVVLPNFPIASYLQCMRHDKKNFSEKISFVLLKSIGDPCVVSDINIEYLWT